VSHEPRRVSRLHSRQPQTRNALIGVTNDLRTRLEQHRNGHGSEFVKKYGVHRLVHVETFASPQEAIAREKQLKNWHRDWKIRLIEEDNPDWSDLSQIL
jgi:putative endonuclease